MGTEPEPITQERLADNLRRAIKAAGLTQAQVAERVELDPTALSKILTGKRKVSSLELALICTATGSDVLGLLEAEPMHGPSFRAGVEWVNAKALQAQALREAADDIQALHPGEVKNSVIWLRERADRINAHP